MITISINSSYFISLISIVLLASCQRKTQDIDTSQPPPNTKSGYVPQTGSGKNPVDGPLVVPPDPNLPSPQSALGNGNKGTPEELKYLEGWDGSSDLLTDGWSLSEGSTTVSPSTPPAANNGPATSTTPPAPAPAGSTVPVGGSQPSTGSGSSNTPTRQGGVTTTPAPSTPQAGPVTYANQIKPLMDKYCISCHAAGKSRASSPLTSYPSGLLATQVTTKVANGSMPKAGSPQLTAQEKALFAAWVKNNHAP